MDRPHIVILLCASLIGGAWLPAVANSQQRGEPVAINMALPQAMAHCLTWEAPGTHKLDREQPRYCFVPAQRDTRQHWMECKHEADALVCRRLSARNIFSQSGARR